VLSVTYKPFLLSVLKLSVILSVIMLSVIILRVILLSVTMLSVIMLSVIILSAYMPSVVAQSSSKIILLLPLMLKANKLVCFYQRSTMVEK
jgi:hypothetical protein